MVFRRGLGIAIGGPMLVWRITPTEEEVFQRYSPELQKKSLANRYDREKQFDDFVNKLKEYSKDDRNSKYCPLKPTVSRNEWEQ